MFGWQTHRNRAVKVDFLVFQAAESVNRDSLSAAAVATQLLSRALMAL